MGNKNENEGINLSLRRFLILILGLSLVLFIFTFYPRYSSFYEGKVYEHVIIEAGSPITMDLFTNDLENVKPAYDFTQIDTKVLGHYRIPFCCDNRRYESILTIVDTIAPTGETKDLTIDVNQLPDVSEFVVSYSDVTPVSISYSVVPDVSIGGLKEGSVSFKDIAGNETIVPFQVTVIDDFDAPLIYGIKPITVYQDDKVKYRDGLRVEDNMDPNPTLSIDTSEVDISTPGVYTVSYTATDATGNTRTSTTKITVLEKPEGYVEPEDVYNAGQKYLDMIIDPTMSDIDKGFKIYNWCKTYINYIGTSTKTHWTIGAYEGFTTLSGDCFTYAACAKAMCDMCGIECYVIERCDPGDSTHFWNLLCIEGNWYFMDCSRTNTPMNAYLLTDQELYELQYTHGYRYKFDPTGLPNRSDVSIQYRLNYYTLTAKEA